MWRGIAFVGVVMAAATLVVLDASLPGGAIAGHGTLRYGQTMAFNTLMLAQMFNVLNSRSDERSAFDQPFTNAWLWVALATSIALQALVIHVPVLQHAFGTVGLSGRDWMVSAAAASSVLWARARRPSWWRERGGPGTRSRPRAQSSRTESPKPMQRNRSGGTLAAWRACSSARSGASMASVVNWNGAEVHADAQGGTKVEVRLHGLRRIHVDVLHKPARLVGADGQQGEVDRGRALADLAEERHIAAVAGKIRCGGLHLDDREASPERAVAVEWRTAPKSDARG